MSALLEAWARLTNKALTAFGVENINFQIADVDGEAETGQDEGA